MHRMDVSAKRLRVCSAAPTVLFIAHVVPICWVLKVDESTGLMRKYVVYTPCPKKGATTFLPLTLPILTDFESYFTDRLSSAVNL